MCSLDAEGAFDAIPHSVLFLKAIDIIPDHYWKTMVQWYRNMTVMIKWNGALGDPIQIERGTRQGGLTSPFLFNLFYQDLIEMISSKKCGITIDGNQYNIYYHKYNLHSAKQKKCDLFLDHTVHIFLHVIQAHIR